MNKYQGDVIRIEKLDTSKVFTVVYWDNAAKAYYVKRFNFTESNNNPVVFISEARGSKLVDISSDDYPQLVLTFGGKFAHREPETVDVAEFIAKKGISAKGKKCSPYDLKAVEFGEPLEKDEPEVPGEAIAAEPFDGDDDMADDAPVADDAVDQVQPGESDAVDQVQPAPRDKDGAKAAAPSEDASEAQAYAPDSGVVDFDDWEPTLF